ncbi:MAG: riboflavin synthase [Candidatus Eisenbacteria bacterium]
MFTGLVEERGHISEVEERLDGRRLWVTAVSVLEGAAIGDSLSVCGVCLTAVALEPGRFAVEAVPETLRRTTLGLLQPGDPVNLERPLTLAQRLGGHLVQGHVDGVGEVATIATEGDGWRVRLKVPTELRRFVAEKGSLTVDGVSLTVAGLTDDGCEIAYIPHTLAVTTAGTYKAGRRVNLEVDLLARYLARLLEDAGSPRRSS